MATGTVKWFNEEKGFGFIEADDQTADVFVHVSALKSSGLDAVDEGAKVEYDVEQGKKGLQASNVTIL